MIPSSDRSKPYKLTFNVRPEHLFAHIEGEHDSYEISHAYWQEIAEECERTGLRKVLVVEDIPEEVSVSEAFQIGAELPQMGFAGVQIAFVDKYADQAEINSFSNLVAVNRGLNCIIFSNTSDAESWLRSEPPARESVRP